MADTIRTRSAILSLFADNTSRDISPQDLRDFVVSAHGVYGGIYLLDGSTAQTGISTTPAKMTGWGGNLAAAGVTPDYTDGSLTVGTDGVYKVEHNISFLGNGSNTYKGRLRIDGVEHSAGWTDYRASGDYLSAGFVTLVSLSAGEKLTIYLESNAGGGVSLTPFDAQLVCFRIA